VTEWNDLSIEERAAIRKLALGYTHEVSLKALRRLAKLGLVEDGLDARLTAAGFEMYRANPPVHKGGRPKQC
jgi:hypothetical protein